MSSVTDNSERRRFELTIDDQTAFADYQTRGDQLILPHVEAPPALRGTGAAGRLMQGVMEIARARNLRVVPLCSYAAAWIKRHPEWNESVS